MRVSHVKSLLITFRSSISLGMGRVATSLTGILTPAPTTGMLYVMMMVMMMAMVASVAMMMMVMMIYLRMPWWWMGWRWG